ncbi:MAG: zf-HC2 domain-containing protein [Vicinamibacteria bacterium]
MSAHERERLCGYLDGELSVGERAEVEAHLATCSECASLLAEMGAVDERARELPIETPRGYFEAFPGRVRARVEGLSPAQTRAATGRRRWPIPVWTWAAAAALILAVVTPLTLRETRQDEAAVRPVLAVEAPRDASVAESRPSIPEGLVAGAADDEPAREAMASREEGRERRAQEPVAKPERMFALAPPAAAVPPRAVPQRSVGKADARGPAEVPSPGAQNRPLELEKDAPRFVQAAPAVVAESELPEEKAAVRFEGAHQEAVIADALSSSVAGEPALGAATAPKPAAAALQAGEAGRKRLARSDKKAGLDEDTRAFSELARRGTPANAATWRQRREAWRAFVAEHPESPHAGEARVRVVEAGLEAWRAGGDSEDLARAREDAAAYLARDDAVLEERVRRALEAIEE